MTETERQIEKGDVAYLAGPHEPWCNFVAHDGCCHKGDDEQFSCECGVWQRKQDIAAALAEERAKARAPFLAEMKPGRWWRVVAADGSLWCETSDEDEARASVRPGDRIERLHEMRVTEWRAAE